MTNPKFVMYNEFETKQFKWQVKVLPYSEVGNISYLSNLPDKYSPDLSKWMPSVDTSNGIQPVSYNKGEIQ